MHKITAQKSGKETTLTIKSGKNLYAELAKSRLMDAAPCGGKGLCGKCRVKITENCPDPTDADFKFLTEDEITRGVRLACKIDVRADMTVRLSHDSKDFGGMAVLDNSIKPKKAFFALDIGTTTLDGVLIDEKTGTKLLRMTKLNPQKTFGADVFTRLNFSLESDEKKLLLKETIINAINHMLTSLCEAVEILPTDIIKVAISANTTMIHMLLGESVSKLAFAPFETDFLAPEDITGKALSLICVDASVHMSPASSSFVGGDITAGAVALDLDKDAHTTLFIDLGTNGEMIFANNGAFVGCSVAAGPAFEGAEIACGMSALSGAVNEVSFDGDIKFETVDDKPPKGICGSGLLDVIAELINLKLIDTTGKLIMQSDNERLNKRLKQVNGIDSFVLYDDKKSCIYINQKDIRNFQLAKAAVRTGIDMLLEKEEATATTIDAVYIAGGFGSHLKSENLFRCGILPFEHEHIKVVGNTSLKGSIKSVSDEAFKKRVHIFSKKVDVFLLSKHPNFQNLFIENMMFE